MPAKKEIRKERAKQARDSLSDNYIIDLLLNSFPMKLNEDRYLKVSDIRKFPELIECKRIQMKIFRLIKSKRKCGNQIIKV